eukprot:scaffold57530_cov24-Tisochrysis_lutea.AAC.2
MQTVTCSCLESGCACRKQEPAYNYSDTGCQVVARADCVWCATTWEVGMSATTISQSLGASLPAVNCLEGGRPGHNHQPASLAKCKQQRQQ